MEYVIGRHEALGNPDVEHLECFYWGLLHGAF